MKQARLVLCMALFSLSQLVKLPKIGARKLIPFNFTELTHWDLGIKDRNKVDSVEPTGFVEGMEYPQLLPYVVIRYKNKILNYSRAKGTEARLHGTRSIGFGGHMDMTTLPEDLAATLQTECQREIQEEVGITLNNFHFSHFIVDYTNSVGSVHLGILAVVDLTDEQYAAINIDATEISDPRWEELGDIFRHQYGYENWSQMVIEKLVQESESCLKSSV